MTEVNVIDGVANTRVRMKQKNFDAIPKLINNPESSFWGWRAISLKQYKYNGISTI